MADYEIQESLVGYDGRYRIIICRYLDKKNFIACVY